MFRRTLWPLIYTKQMRTGAEKLFWEVFFKVKPQLTDKPKRMRPANTCVHVHSWEAQSVGRPYGRLIIAALGGSAQRSHRIPAMLLPVLRRDLEAHLYQCSQGGHGGRGAQEDQEDRQVQLGPDRPGE